MTIIISSILIGIVIIFIWKENGGIQILQSSQSTSSLFNKTITMSMTAITNITQQIQKHSNNNHSIQMLLVNASNNTITYDISSDNFLNMSQQVHDYNNITNNTEILMIQQQQQQQLYTFNISESDNMTTFLEEYKIPNNFTTTQDGRTTVLITSNLIPSHPSLWMINETISSISSQLLGLEEDYKLIIGIDGLYRKARRRDSDSRIRLQQYIQALSIEYPNATIIAHPRRIGLTSNVQICLQTITTEYMYLLQHDMPFSRMQTINHTALIQVARASQGYPFCVRFNKDPNRHRKMNRGGCFFQSTFLTNHSGLNFMKTEGWSDK
jgi:hypothetical protein